MPRFRLTLLTALLLAAVAAPAEAKTRVAVGIGDQAPHMFQDADFQRLKIKKVRYFIRWDARRVAYARQSADQYVKAARAAGARVFMHISTNDYRKRKGKLPSVRQYKKFVGWIVKRYRKRGVREFGVWNEANHYTQPTYKNPKRVGQYFKVMRKQCRGCTIVALDLLDQPGVESYARRFYRSLNPAHRRYARIVGIHNYGDTNRRRVSGTRDIIREVRRHNRSADFWFTETGGIVNLGDNWPCNPRRAAGSVKYMFRLARKYRRHVDRLYAYNWFGTQPSCTGFDSGLKTFDGKRRKGFKVFRKQARGFTR